MSLRTRLLLGYGYLVLLILITAASAAVGFFELSKGIGDVVDNNFRSVTAATEMLGALERQDSATLRALVDPDQTTASRDTLSAADSAFDAAFVKASTNATIAGEKKLLVHIHSTYADFRQARDHLVGTMPQRPLAAYNRDVYGKFRHVRGQVFALLDLNQAAIVAADRRARHTAVQNGVWLGILVTLALLSLIFLSRALQRHFLARLGHFREVSEAIAEGESRRRLKPGGDDELGLIARHFNTAIDTQKHLRTEAQGQLNQQRQLLIGALAQRDEPVALLGLDASVIASTLDGDAALAMEAHRGWVHEEGRAVLKAYESGEQAPRREIELGEGKALVFELLLAQKSRPVGWLVRVVSIEVDTHA